MALAVGGNATQLEESMVVASIGGGRAQAGNGCSVVREALEKVVVYPNLILLLTCL